MSTEESEEIEEVASIEGWKCSHCGAESHDEKIVGDIEVDVTCLSVYLIPINEHGFAFDHEEFDEIIEQYRQQSDSNWSVTMYGEIKVNVKPQYVFILSEQDEIGIKFTHSQFERVVNHYERNTDG